MTPEDSDPFKGRVFGDLVFLNNLYRCRYVGLSEPSKQEKWRRKYPELWKTREDALRDLQDLARSDVQAEPAGARLKISANDVRASGKTDDALPVPGEDKRLPDKPATNNEPLTIATPEVRAAAGDEITIGERRFISERRVAAMLSYSPRQLQRWRTEQKGPPSTQIGRRVFYEIKKLQEWIEREKRR